MDNLANLLASIGTPASFAPLAPMGGAAPAPMAPPPPPSAPPAGAPPPGIPRPPQPNRIGQTLQTVMPFVLAGLAAKNGGKVAAGAMLQGFSQGAARAKALEQQQAENEAQAQLTAEARQQRLDEFKFKRQAEIAAFGDSILAKAEAAMDPGARAELVRQGNERGRQIYGAGWVNVQPFEGRTKADVERERKAAQAVLDGLEKKFKDQPDQLAELIARDAPIRVAGTQVDRPISHYRALVGEADAMGPDGKPVAPIAAAEDWLNKAAPGQSEFSIKARPALASASAAKGSPLTPAEISTVLDSVKTADPNKIQDAIDALRLQQMGQSGGRRPITETAEANLIRQLSGQWTTATAPSRELNRQLALMRTGVKAAERGDMAQGAQVILVTFQKILDPPSVVRESEYMRSAAGLALLDRVRGWYEQLHAGGAGVPLEQLQKYAKLAEEAAQAQNDGYLASVKNRITKTAQRYQIPEELLGLDFDPYEAKSPESGAATAPKPPANPKKNDTWDRLGQVYVWDGTAWVAR